MYSAAPGLRGSSASPKQKEHRARFSTIIRMSKPLKGAIKIGMKESASKRHLLSPSNLFVNHNLQHTTYDTATGSATPIYSEIILAEGEVPYASFGTPSLDVPQQVTVTFTGNNDWPGAFEDDKIYAVAYCPDINQSALAFTERSTGTVTIQLPSNWTGKTFHLWGFALTSVTEKYELESYGIAIIPGECSSSVYIGSGMIG